MTQPQLEVYLFFNGRCEEALEFYKKTLGAEVSFLMRYSESPSPMPPDTLPPGFENKVMHTSFCIGSTRLMASDGCSPSGDFNNFSLSLALANAEEVDRVFNALAEGGTITMPPDKTFWSPRFGMLKDRFGLGWMISVAVDEA